MSAALRRRFERWIVTGWTRRGAVRFLFAPLAWLTGAIARRRYAARRLQSPVAGLPVVVVGNLIAGGAGKTPIVIALVQALQARGRRPGVVARGYAAPAQRQAALVEAGSDPAVCGDEPVLVAERTGAPVAVHRERALAVQALLRAHPDLDVVVSDDGLQHYSLARRVELVVFDGRGAGNGAFLPAGPLREPIDRVRDATLFSACPIDPALCADSPAFSVPIAATQLRVSATDTLLDAAHFLAGRPVSAYAGMADPGKFFATLRALGAQVDAHPLPDHTRFAAGSFADAREDCIVVTEKDAVKCARIPALARDPRLHVLRVDAQLDPALIDLVMEKLDGPQAA